LIEPSLYPSPWVVAPAAIFTAVSVVIVAILLVCLVMAYSASDSSPRQSVMAGHMANDSTNHRAFDAPGSNGG
jgi:hypothetical protein